MRALAIPLAIVLASALAPVRSSADTANSAETARILAQADSIRAHQDEMARILARADSIRALPSRDSLLLMELRYQQEKKEPIVGLGLGLLFPGLGNFYAGDEAGGVFLLGAGILGVALASSEGSQSLGSSMIVATIITSPIAGAMAASDHNRKVRKKLGLELAGTPGRSAALALTARF